MRMKRDEWGWFEDYDELIALRKKVDKEKGIIRRILIFKEVKRARSKIV